MKAFGFFNLLFVPLLEKKSNGFNASLLAQTNVTSLNASAHVLVNVCNGSQQLTNDSTKVAKNESELGFNIIHNATSLSLITSRTMNEDINSVRRFMRISFVNGIYHSEEEWQKITVSLQEVFGQNVKSFYNPSSGNWVQDATRAGYNLVLRPNDLEVANSLASHLRGILSEIPPGGRLLHIAHSAGALLTYLAAKHHLNYNETSRIDVVTFGPARSITRKYFQGRLVNYYATNDPVVLLDKRAGHLIRKINSALHWISERWMVNTSYYNVRDAKHNTSFVFLTAIANNPILDHSMEGPTYRLAMEIEAADFHRRLEEMAFSNSRKEASERDLIRKIRKTTARMTGFHHFWDRVSFYETVRAVRKYSANISNMHHFIEKLTTISINTTFPNP